MLIVYGIRNCDTIKKTLNWLTAEDYEHRLHDYRKQGIPDTLIEQLIEQFSIEQLINRRGTTWRKLPESQKHNLTRSSVGKLMQANPSLIKRPIISDGKHWLIGFDPQAITNTF